MGTACNTIKKIASSTENKKLIIINIIVFLEYFQ